MIPVPGIGSLRWSARWAAWIVLASGAVLAVAAWFSVQSVVERDARVKFHVTADAIADTIQARLRNYSYLLYGLRGLFQAEPAVSRAAFERYVASLNLALDYPNVRSVSYAEFVPGPEKAKFEMRLRRDPDLVRRGYANVAIRPPGERSQYLVLTYVEPLHTNRAAIGFDLAAGAERAIPIERARDTGMPTGSERLVLALDPARKVTGIVLRLALYRKDAFTPDVAQRRAAFVGMANVTFVVQELAQDVLSAEGFQTFTLSIRDSGYVDRDPASRVNPAGEELYSNSALHPHDAGAVFADSLRVEVGQRRWILNLSAPQREFHRASDQVLPWAASAAVLMLALLLGGLIRSLGSSAHRARALAERMTADLRQSERRLIEAQRRTQELIEVLPNPIFFKGTDGRYLGVNKAWERYFGRTRDTFIGNTVHELYPDRPEVADLLHAKDQELWERPGSQVVETTITTPDGKLHNTIYYKATFSNAEGKVAGLIGTIIDITERKHAEKRQAMEHAVTRVLADAGTLSEASSRIIQIICEAMGWDCGARWELNQEAKVLRCAEYWGRDTPAVLEFMTENAKWDVDPGITSSGGLLRPIYNSGRPVWIVDISQNQHLLRARLVRKAGMRGAFGFPLLLGNEVLGVMEFFHRDVREPDDALLRIAESIGNQIGQYIVRKQAEELVRHLAHFDELTQLSNRSMFVQQITHALAQARRNDKPLAVLYIDLDRFKNVNDTLGHEAGDRVLTEVAKRLRGCLRDSDIIGRLGGDEFAVMLEDLRPAHGAEVAQKILAAMTRPFVVDAQEFHLGASIGISNYPGDCNDAQSLLKSADIAMYRAKEHGRNNYQFYSAQMNVHMVERLALESDLRHALERDELVLHYQPKVGLRSGHITGMEALVRWQHPAKGLIAPLQFIPLAEETNLIVSIGEWVLKTACAQNKAWQEQGLPPLRVAVNLSARQFAHAELLQDVARVLKETRLDPAFLELEITESMLMQDTEHAVSLLTAFKAMGIHLSVDDFGTGYSSLSYLKRFPIDALKIDRSFIHDIPQDSDDAAITLAIIAMAHSLRLEVIAEGVETVEQRSFLLEHRCNEMQGYYFSKPVAAHEFAGLLRENVVREAASRRRPNPASGPDALDPRDSPVP